MAEYSYIKFSFWADPENEKLSPEAKLVFLYLISNPQGISTKKKKQWRDKNEMV